MQISNVQFHYIPYICTYIYSITCSLLNINNFFLSCSQGSAIVPLDWQTDRLNWVKLRGRGRRQCPLTESARQPRVSTELSETQPSENYALGELEDVCEIELNSSCYYSLNWSINWVFPQTSSRWCQGINWIIVPVTFLGFSEALLQSFRLLIRWHQGGAAQWLSTVHRKDWWGPRARALRRYF